VESNRFSIAKVNETLRGSFSMRYVKEEGGLLNNFAIEPKMYEAEPPTQNQKRNYIILGIAGALLVGGLMAVAVSVS
jgi:hypothetical protein